MALKDGSPEDYPSAAVRHYRNALTLRDAGQLDNAGHLVGFAAECAIKHRIGISGAQSANLHLPEMLPSARRLLGTRANFAGMYNIIKGAVLPGWSVDHRYSPDGKVTAQVFEVWAQEAKRLLGAAGLKAKE